VSRAGKEPEHITALEVEHRRLVQVTDILMDMNAAAHEVMGRKEYRDCGAEMDKLRYAGETGQQVNVERSQTWDQLLVARYGREEATRMQAEARAWVEDCRLQVVRERRSRERRRSR
jgi:hypothetical protein